MFTKLNPTVYYFSKLNDKKYDKIAIFDLDYTLVRPKTKVHPENADDWTWMFPIVPQKMKELSESGYYLIIISNQLGLPWKKFLLNRIENIIKHLPDIDVYVSVGNNMYRKPNTGIFEKYILPKFSDIKDIFYVGDAAGRDGDFSDSDRKFAYNIHLLLKHKKINVKFYTPEEYFLKNHKKHKKSWSGFDPISFIKNNPVDKMKEYINKIKDISDKNQSVFIVIGQKSSGKTTFSKKIESDNIKYIYGDGKYDPSVHLEKVLQSGKSAIIDGKCLTKDCRKKYLEVCRNFPNVKTYFVYMNTFYNIKNDIELYNHLNIYNGRLTGKKFDFKYEKYDAPSENEGAEQVFKIPFYPSFENEDQFIKFIQKS